MSTFTIKIDRRSIRRNKTYRPPKRPEQWISGTRLKFHHGEWWVQHFTAKRCRVVIGEDGRFCASKPWGVEILHELPAEPEDFMDCRNSFGNTVAVTYFEPEDGRILSIEVKEESNVFGPPWPKPKGPTEPFRFKYVKITRVACRECGKRFDTDELRYRQGSHCDCCDRGEDESFRICPKCGESDCCDVVREELPARVMAQCARRNEERAKGRKTK